MPPIALVTRIDTEEEAVWLDTLRAALPHEEIMSFHTMDEAQRRNADIAIVANPDPADLHRLPHLTWIHSLWAGVERLVSELGNSKVPVVRLIDPQMSRTMAQAVLAWTLYLFRDMPAYRAQQQARIWRQLPYRRAQDTTVGLLGMGALGSVAAERLVDAGFKVAGWSRAPKRCPGVDSYHGEDGLLAMAARTDILVCLLPLTPATAGIVDKHLLSALPKGASLINFARGRIVATPDLIAALDGGHLSHAVLDVFTTEPLPSEDPLWMHPGITVLPHISAPTDPQTAAELVAANITAYRQSGVMPQTVDFSRGY